jgi:hypothetical protein
MYSKKMQTLKKQKSMQGKIQDREKTVTVGQNFDITVSLLNQYGEPAKAARNIDFSVNAYVIASRTTSYSTGTLMLKLPAGVVGPPEANDLWATITPTGNTLVQGLKRITVL